MTINEFRDKLKNTFVNNSSNLKSGVSYLRTQGLKPNSEINDRVLLLQQWFISIDKDFTLGLLSDKDYYPTKNRIINTLIQIINEIGIDDLNDDALEDIFQTDRGLIIRENVEDAETKEENDKYYNNTNNTNINNLRIDRKFILEKININKILLPTDSHFFDDTKSKHHYIQQLLWCQELMASEDYNKAYETCEYIKTNLESRSAQLYEYLFISYFKLKGGEDSIVLDIEENRNEVIKKLEFYAKRCKQFNNEQKTSETADANIDLVSNKITYILKSRYLSILFDYMLSGDNKDFRRRIEIYIDTAIDIVTEINVSGITVFLEYALNELNGGGKLEWIDIDTNWKLIDKHDYHAIEKRRQVAHIVFKGHKREKSLHRLHRHLGIKYGNLKSVTTDKEALPEPIDIANGKEDDQTEPLNFDENFYNTEGDADKNTQSTKIPFLKISDGTTKSKGNFKNIQSAISFIKSSIVAYLFYNDKAFLELPLKELEGDGKIVWYQLDETGEEIIAVDECKELKYDPKSDLIKMLKILQPEKAVASVLEPIKSFLTKQAQLKKRRAEITVIDKKYNDIRTNKLPISDGERREEVIKCMEEWIKIYDKYNKDERLLTRCIKELSGSRVFLWLDVAFQSDKSPYLINSQVCKSIGYDALSQLKILQNKSRNFSEITEQNKLEKTIFSNIGKKQYAYNSDKNYNDIKLI